MHTLGTQRALTLQTLQETGSDHLTEDALFTASFEHHVVMLVADGAPLRLRPIRSMQPLLDRFAPLYGDGITPAGITSRLTRATVAQCIAEDPTYPLADAILASNQRLADLLSTHYGDLSAQTLLRHEPHLTILAEDPRYLRLMLPACTYTLARVDLQHNVLEVAHGADSALFLFMADGRIEQITPDQMKAHDDAFKRLWLETGNEPAQHPFFRALGDNRALELNRMNGLYHNYISTDGTPDPAVGVSVINGLPEIAHYMFTARLPLDGIEAVLLTTDGMFWPEPPQAPLNPEENLMQMRARIERDGLRGYLQALRAEETRLRESGINPYQGHDDATAVLMRWGAPSLA